MTRLLLPMLWLIAMLASSSARADGVGVLADVLARRYDAIEQRLGAVDQAFRAGKATEYDLLDAYKDFYRISDDSKFAIVTWRQQRPNSAAAHLANGIHLRVLGELYRGQGEPRSIPPENRQAMVRQFDAAKVELWRAWDLNPGSFLALLNLMNIAEFENDGAGADKVMALGTTAWPHNLLLRARHLQHLSPRWGGTVAAMDADVEAARTTGAPPLVVRLLEAIHHDEQGEALQSTGHVPLAMAEYRKALALARGADRRFAPSYLPHALDRCRIARGGGGVDCH